MKVTSCSCFEKFNDERNKELGKRYYTEMQVLKNNQGTIDVFLDICTGDGEYDSCETIVTGATYCPFCSKKIEIKED